MLAKTPAAVKWLFPRRIWSIPSSDKALFLTFDDGPIPEVTPWVLEQLNSFGAKATFFCIGDNARRHPDLLVRLKQEGHTIGNHTHNHLNGWKTSSKQYLENVLEAEQSIGDIGEVLNGDRKFFRPPYGRITSKQARLLKEQGYQIVMWDVLSGDYNQNFLSERCARRVLRHAKRGSIIVLHDSLKAEKHLRAILPKILEHYTSLGYRFEALK